MSTEDETKSRAGMLSKWLAGIVGTVVAGVLTFVVIEALQKTTNDPESKGPSERVEVPHAPPIESGGDTLYDETLLQIRLEPGQKEWLRGMELWSAPTGSQPSCAAAFLKFTWQLRDPYPSSGNDLEFHRNIPMGGGRTEVFERGATGSSSMGWCSEIYLYNISLESMHVEIRYASGLHD
jgi:hypothetical protein